MHRSTPLPPQDDFVPASEESMFPDNPEPDAVPSRSTATVNGQNVYMIQVKQKGAGISQIELFTHAVLFTAAQVEAMITEASSITMESCLGNRRLEMAKAKVGISDPIELNERWFPSDVDFFKAVMLDKFEFKVLQATVGTTSIEPTVLVNAA